MLPLAKTGILTLSLWASEQGMRPSDHSGGQSSEPDLLDRLDVFPAGQAGAGAFLLARSSVHCDELEPKNRALVSAGQLSQSAVTYGHSGALDHLGVLDRLVNVLEDAYLGRDRYLEIVDGVGDLEQQKQLSER